MSSPMTGVGRSLRRLREDARNAFYQAPLEVAIGFLVAGLFSYMLETETGPDAWAPLAVFAAVALPLVFGTTLLHARGRLGARGRWVGAVLAVAVAAYYAFAIFDPELESEGWRAALLAAASVALLSLLPVVEGGAATARRERFWLFNARLAARVATVAGYGLALFLGLAAALGSVTALFDVDVSGVAYGHLFGWIAFALVPWIVVGGVPALAAEPQPVAPAARRYFRWLDAYLLAPLLVTYAAILYAYVVRIVVVGEVPKNVLSPLVLGAGLLWLAADFLFEPLRDAPDGGAGLAALVRVYPLALLPMVGLGVWAVGVRVEQYGWTEFRYIRLAVFLGLGILGILAGVRIRRGRAAPLVEAPALLAGVLLLAAVGPWGALAVSRRSQQARLAAVIGAARRSAAPAGARGDGEGQVAVPAQLVREIDSSARYLARHFGVAAVAAVAPEAGEAAERRTGRFAAALGFIPASESPPMLVVAGLPDSAAVPGVVDGTWYRVRLGVTGPTGPWPGGSACLEMPGGLGRVPRGPRGSMARRLAGLSLALDTTAHRIRAGWNGAELSADLAPLVARVIAQMDAGCRHGVDLAPLEARIDLRDAAGRRRGQLILTRIAVRVSPADAGGVDGTGATGGPGGAGVPAAYIRGVEGHLIIAAP
ncbi:MAG TPA: DUF4153 domain-containing protein [Longimicrobiales bacterium]